MSFANNSLIVALDVPTAAEARRIFDELRETGCAFKIGLQLFTVAGSSFVRELIERDAKIFLDLKFHDIPNTVAAAAIEAVRLGVWMFNVHAAGGGEMMERTVNAVRETVARENLIEPKIIAVTVLTSSNGVTLGEIGIESAPADQVLRLAKLASDADLNGVVASAHEAARIKSESKKWKTIDAEQFLIVTPGIRLQPEDATGIGADDQKRILTPAAAIKSGADYLVVGRPILTAANKIEVVQKILREIETANQFAAR